MTRTPTTILDYRLCAFLDVIGWSETLNEGDDGYNVLVGGGTFPNYRDHPRIVVTLKHKDGSPVLVDGQPLRSTAAGRYQIKASIFDAYRVQLDLHDFGPIAQDAIAVQLIKECGAVADILAGNIADAITKCSSRWASFPGASYGQPTHPMPDLLGQYQIALSAYPEAV